MLPRRAAAVSAGELSSNSNNNKEGKAAGLEPQPTLRCLRLARRRRARLSTPTQADAGSHGDTSAL